MTMKKPEQPRWRQAYTRAARAYKRQPLTIRAALITLVPSAFAGLAYMGTLLFKTADAISSIDESTVSASVTLRQPRLADDEFNAFMESGESTDSLLFSYRTSQQGSQLTVRPDFDRYQTRLLDPGLGLTDSDFNSYYVLGIPQLDVQIINNSSRTVAVEQISLAMRSYAPYLDPFILIAGPYDHGCFGFVVQNAGREPVDHLRTRFNIARANSPTDRLNWRDLPFSAVLERAEPEEEVGSEEWEHYGSSSASPPSADQTLFIWGDSILLAHALRGDYSSAIKAEAKSIIAAQASPGGGVDTWAREGALFHQMGFTDPNAAQDPANGEHPRQALVYGTVDYRFRGRQRSIRFAKTIRSVPECAIGGPRDPYPATYRYNVLLDSAARAGAGFVTAQSLKPQETARFGVALGSRVSGRYQFDVYLHLNGGRKVRAAMVDLLYLLPRFRGARMEIAETDEGILYMRLSSESDV